MAVVNLKSASITNLDATPVVPNSTGEGAPGYIKNASDFVTVGAADSATSTYRVARLPTNAKLKALKLFADAILDSNGSPTLTYGVGAAYSDSTVDGTASSLQGTLISATAFRATAAFGATGNISADVLTAYGAAKRNQPLWQGLGLTSDPGGFIDVLVTVGVAAATGVSAAIGADAAYVM